MSLKNIFLIIFILIITTNPLSAHAREYMIGTFAYAYANGGFPNIFVQASITDNTAWLFDKCDDDGNTYTGIYKNYWQEYADGPYWFGGLVYKQNGSQRGTSLTAGLGYEHLIVKNISVGAYAGAAAGGNGQRYGVFDITLAYVFH